MRETAMRTPSLVARTVVTAAAAALLVLASAAFALAKEGGIVTLSAPIPRDAEPGSTLTVEFTVTVPGEDGMTPLTGSPMVLKLSGPDGTTTEAMAAAHGTPGTYVASIEVPASGITTATFGLRGTATAADGTTSLQDIAFDVDGLLFTTSPHAATGPTRGPTTSGPHLRLAAAAALAAVVAVVGVGLLLNAGRRRSMRSA
jgi:hypothetical protein